MKCSICGGPFHPATGYMVGHPTEYPVCGACFVNEIIPTIKNASSKMFCIRKNSKEKKFVYFYDYV